MNLRAAVVLIPVFLGLAACSQGSRTNDEARIATPVAPVTALVSIESLQLKPLVCGAPRGCPPSVGQLIVQSARGPSFCTATLVAPDLILTASHCLLPATVGGDRAINGNCWVRFPASGGRVEKAVPCAAIVKTSELDLGQTAVVQMDWAFVRLSHAVMNRPPLAIVDDDALSGRRKTSVMIFGVSIADGGHTIRRELCRRDDSFTLPERKALPGETIIMPACHIEKGYSGGPILDPRTSDLLGVVSFMKNRDATTMNQKRGLAVGTDAPELPR